VAGEQWRSTSVRPYRMSKRAEHVEETRQRIVEAAVTLHGTVGPAKTTIAGIAAEAGVTRLTVYRHFPDEDALYAACSAHWMSTQVMPDPGAWSTLTDAKDRLRAGLSDLYRYYREGEAMLTRVLGQIDSVPESMRQQLAQMESGYLKVLLRPFGAKSQGHRLRAVVGHATSFWTWRSLCVERGLSHQNAVQLMTDLAIMTSNGHGESEPRGGPRRPRN
jgi:AcrR family transcriptional regulator